MLNFISKPVTKDIPCIIADVAEHSDVHAKECLRAIVGPFPTSPTDRTRRLLRALGCVSEDSYRIYGFASTELDCKSVREEQHDKIEGILRGLQQDPMGGCLFIRKERNRTPLDEPIILSIDRAIEWKENQSC